jgi:citrate/tricarballylate utilization protein
LTLENLKGGGEGCYVRAGFDHPPERMRRWFHHLTFYGFLLCFASTTLATIYHYALKVPAPYPLMHPVVILGTVGGLGLVAGPAGLRYLKGRHDPILLDEAQRPLDSGFTWLLLLTSLTGLALLFLRDTAAMPSLLAIHLGVVLALFLTLPYGKFVHGIYRSIALRHYARGG